MPRSYDNRRCPRRRAAIALLAGVAVLFASRATATDPRRAAMDLRVQYAADLEQLAAWCDNNGLSDEAGKTRRALGPNDPYKIYLPALSDEIGPPKLPADAPAEVVEWDSRLSKLRADHAKTLYEMARRAVKTGRPGFAFELAMAAIQANPDYEPVRKLLGYKKYRDQWRTFYAAKKLQDGFEWSDKFGWQPKSSLARYNAGQRYYEGRWISASEDADRHHDIKQGWRIDSEHYAIRTNDSIEAAVALEVKLERLYRLWQQLFIGYYASEGDVTAWFEGRSKSLSGSVPLHQVAYFRDREDFKHALRAVVPNIDIPIGMYIDQSRTAYFFGGKDSDDRTLYHEATHQLFHESRLVAPDVGRRCNFWIVEGIAMYMESLRREDGYYVLGGFDDERLHAAQYRLLHDNFYVPLQEFAGYGMEKIQKDPRIATLYSQAAGLTHFLVHYDNGRYRDALVAYLMTVYAGRDQPDTLAKLTGTSFADLDKQYREFLTTGLQKEQGKPRGEETLHSR
jgi:hypothetical protein